MKFSALLNQQLIGRVSRGLFKFQTQLPFEIEYFWLQKSHLDMLMIEKTVQYLIGVGMVRTENLDFFFL